MTRLTNDIRKAIVSDVIAHRFQEEYTALCVKWAALAEKCYIRKYGADIKKMDALPEDWLPKESGLRCSFSGRVDYLYFSSGIRVAWSDGMRSPVATHKRVAFRDTRGAIFLHLDADDPLSMEYDALDAERDEFKARVSKARRQAAAAVESVGTIKRLVEVWPEIEPFTKRHTEAKPQLPAVNVDALNGALGLPVGATA